MLKNFLLKLEKLNEKLIFNFVWIQVLFLLRLVTFCIGHEDINPSRPNPGRKEKNKLNFYFHTSL